VNKTFRERRPAFLAANLCILDSAQHSRSATASSAALTFRHVKPLIAHNLIRHTLGQRMPDRAAKRPLGKAAARHKP
jgi:hypothetical protein